MSARRLPVALSPKAVGDYEDIKLYTLREWGEGQWIAYEAALLQALESLGELPQRGRARDDLRPGARSLLARQHIIVYEVLPDMVRVAAILHRSRDLRAALAEDQ